MKLLEQVNRVGRQMRLADRTIEAYIYWIRRYLAYSARRFGGWKRPEELFTGDLEHFLSHLVLDKRLSASSQNQALNAIVFLYRRVLQDAISPAHLGKLAYLRSKRPKRVPTVLSVDEVRRLIEQVPVKGNYRLMVQLLYGTGLRVNECCTLRVRGLEAARKPLCSL
jgi:site-specific recombinase XerD